MFPKSVSKTDGLGFSLSGYGKFSLGVSTVTGTIPKGLAYTEFGVYVLSIQAPGVNLHFAHANGFPAASDQKLFNALPENFEVIALDKFGHTPRFPISNNWSNQVAELIHYVEGAATAPVYAVGHSFGAVICYMAVCTRRRFLRA